MDGLPSPFARQASLVLSGNVAVAEATSGDNEPNVTGQYYANGTYGGETLYTRMDGAYNVWADGGLGYWVISTAAGSRGTSYFEKSFPGAFGSYSAGGSASGSVSFASL
jgi:hypothetical protein